MPRLKPLPPDHNLSHLDAALGHVSDWSCAVDGGANRGIWTREMLKRFERVIAFEPMKEYADSISPEAEVISAALGECDGAVSLAPGTNNEGQWHIRGLGVIPMFPLDALNLSALGFLKLDVEGYELRALEGARETILRCRPVVMIEENGLCRRYGIAEGAAPEYLEGLGMRHVQTCKKSPSSREHDMVFAW